VFLIKIRNSTFDLIQLDFLNTNHTPIRFNICWIEASFELTFIWLNSTRFDFIRILFNLTQLDLILFEIYSTQLDLIQLDFIRILFDLTQFGYIRTLFNSTQLDLTWFDLTRLNSIWLDLIWLNSILYWNGQYGMRCNEVKRCHLYLLSWWVFILT